MSTLLIDINEMKLLKVVEGEKEVRRCEYWADILIPKSEFYICGDAKRDLTQFSLLELKMLYRGLRNHDIMGNDYKRSLDQVHMVIMETVPDDATLGELVKKLGKPLKEQDFTPVKEKEEPKHKQVGGIPNRPKEGTMTERVWQAADYFISIQPNHDINGKHFRSLVIEACVKGGLNSSTAATQFGKWKRHLNAG